MLGDRLRQLRHRESRHGMYRGSRIYMGEDYRKNAYINRGIWPNLIEEYTGWLKDQWTEYEDANENEVYHGECAKEHLATWTKAQMRWWNIPSGVIAE
jgi:hypothetical protein